MRIPIREQLALLVVLSSMIGVAVIAIAVWINNYNFVIRVTLADLALAASLKAGQIAADLILLQSVCGTIVTRVLTQKALTQFYQGNNTDANWVKATTDIQTALANGGTSSTLLQTIVFSRNATGNPHGILNVTVDEVPQIILPYRYANDTPYLLGDAGYGYPPQLYPNITYVETDEPDPTNPAVNATVTYAFPDFILNQTSTLFLGPMQLNDSFALVSLTMPIINNTSEIDVLGFMTVIAEAATLYSVLTAKEGLGNTGISLLIGPAVPDSLYSYADRPSTSSYTANETALDDAQVNFVFAPTTTAGQTDRHQSHSMSTGGGPPFSLSEYPAALKAFADQNPSVNNASGLLTTKNEEGIKVSVGYARPQSTIVDWVFIVEQAHKEAWEPIVILRNILLACTFGTLGAVLLFVIPVAHYGVRPIARLRDATNKSIQPPGYTPNGSIRSSRLDDFPDQSDDEENVEAPSQRSKTKGGFVVRMRNIRRGGRRKSKAERSEEKRRRIFKIPAKVDDHKHIITDELTELTGTFNEMTDELMMQYSKLEERVAERTRELEISKKAAEAANESKTLFIANISHELKTPLNGILGMCAVCMGEEDLPKIKRSLGVVYKSGDLLLHLLEDLLLFSKNQIGAQLSLEEREFRLEDIRSQIATIFDKQAREGNINFKVSLLGMDEIDLGGEMSEKFAGISLPALGPQGTGRVKNMCLWGDQHRILQVIINLVSNSLKFTPPGGKVEVRIKCVGEVERSPEHSNRNSLGSRQGSQRLSRTRHRVGSGSNTSVTSRMGSSSAANGAKPAGTALLINPMDPSATPHVHVRERSPTPPPSNAKTLMFEFLVEDTGPGIPESLRARVFEPFVQGDLGLSRKYGGTGLGLSICQQLAGLMGGGIELESTTGVGSAFTMRIPLKFVKERASSLASESIAPSSRANSVSAPLGEDRNLMKGSEGGMTAAGNLKPAAIDFEKDTQPRLVGLSQPFFASSPSGGGGGGVVGGVVASVGGPSGSAAATTSSEEQLKAIERAAEGVEKGRKVRVLVAEDNLVNQEVVLRMLKLEDIYDVVVAKDGQEAFDMVKASMEQGLLFNLIFMDIQMPNLDGLQSTRLIRQMGYSAPIVALTAFSEESNVKECMDSGMDMFLSKPIRRPALKQVLRQFTTIPEEVETTSTTTGRSTVDNTRKSSSALRGETTSSQPKTNGGRLEKSPSC